MNARLATLLLLLVAACSAASGREEEVSEVLEILSIDTPAPLLQGSVVRVEGRGIDAVDDPLTLVIENGGRELALPLANLEGSIAEFMFTAGAVHSVGLGWRDLQARLRAGERVSPAMPLSIEVADALPVSLGAAPFGRVRWNELVTLDGDGFLFESEGQLVAALEGTFTPAEGAPRAASADLSVVPVERLARDRGAMILATTLAGVGAGVFEGTIALRSTLANGSTSATAPLALRFDIEPPAVFDVDPPSASVGQYLHVLGGGFVGGSGSADATLLTFDGVFTVAGGSSTPGAVDLVPEFVDGSTLRLVVEPAVIERTLVAAWVGARAGEFRGDVTVETVGPLDSFVGLTTPLNFTVEEPRQVVELRFLPGFDASLAHFGLTSARDEVIAQVAARVTDIYRLFRVDVRTEPPEDFAPIGYSIVEIGGPDPNGKGLLGYDNSPGKDVGNLRLFDRIGGANAETQEDGYAGYGGVFIENFLYWSADPGLPGSRPDGAPPEDPLFDGIFDPVRDRPATLAEVRGEGDDPARLAEVAEAIRGLGNIIGETTAHEIGHSLGLADPWGPANVYHNPFDQAGCLMDGGIDRPFGERAGLGDFSRTRFCGPSEIYLEQILGR